MNESCNYCYSCDFCDSCDYCDYCNYCYSCDSCDSCDSCKSCDYCNFCYFCENLVNGFMCINLKFEKKDKSKYWIFNKEVTKKKWDKRFELKGGNDDGKNNNKRTD